MRQLSPIDWKRVQALAAYLWDTREHKGVGDARMARRIGLSFAFEDRERSRAKLRALMPHVVVVLGTAHPGWTVLRPGSGLAEVTYDPDRVMKVERPRRRKILTAMQRENAALDVVRLHSADPTDQKLAAEFAVATGILERASL